MKRSCSLLFGLLFALAVATAGAAPRLDPQRHGEFLLQPWRDGLPSLVVLVDPNCPYCHKLFRQLDRLDGYNVFLLWAPILGASSERKVASYFRCANPVAPEVLDAALGGRDPGCSGAGEALAALNRETVTAFAPRSVPQYYLEGNPTRLSALIREGEAKESASAEVGFGVRGAGRVALRWARYADFLLSDPESSAPAAALVVDPDGAAAMQERLRRDRRFRWHLFQRLDLAEGERRLGRRVAELNEEFLLLMGVERAPAAYVEGRAVGVATILKGLP